MGNNPGETSEWQNIVVDVGTVQDVDQLAALSQRLGADVQPAPEKGRIVIWRTETTNSTKVDEYLAEVRAQVGERAVLGTMLGPIKPIGGRYLIHPGFVGPDGKPVQPRRDDPLLGDKRITDDALVVDRDQDPNLQ